MAYKYSIGGRKFDDITAEIDLQGNTKIDFEEDYIGLVTSGSSTLVVSGSMAGIGTDSPTEILTINAAADGDECFIQLQEAGSDRAKIGINTSNNLLFHNQHINKHIVFKVNDQGVTREALRIDGAVSEVVVNQSAESLVDFRVESNNNTHMFFVDGSVDKVGINTNQPETALDINSDAIRLRSSNTPSSASDFGHQGEIRWDANYIYVCVATDTWKRVALSSW
tara:strand:- start:3930 stop:4601 length:672 start_codon:yes stop_codon:yes gene_type:complete